MVFSYELADKIETLYTGGKIDVSNTFGRSY